MRLLAILLLSALTVAQTEPTPLAQGSTPMGQNKLPAKACDAVVQASAPGIVPEHSNIKYEPQNNTPAGVSIYGFVTPDTVNFRVCNSTGSELDLSQSPPITINWKVLPVRMPSGKK